MSTNATALLAIYLQDHHAASTAGLELFRRAADGQRSTPAGPGLRTLAEEAEIDHQRLRTLLTAVGVAPSRVKDAATWLGEKAGRLKPNGMLVRRSPLSDIVELEGLALALTGRLACWRLLHTLAESDDRLDGAELDDLADRARDQLDRVERLRLDAARRILGPA